MFEDCEALSWSTGSTGPPPLGTEPVVGVPVDITVAGVVAGPPADSVVENSPGMVLLPDVDADVLLELELLAEEVPVPRVDELVLDNAEEVVVVIRRAVVDVDVAA